MASQHWYVQLVFGLIMLWTIIGFFTTLGWVISVNNTIIKYYREKAAQRKEEEREEMRMRAEDISCMPVGGSTTACRCCNSMLIQRNLVSEDEEGQKLLMELQYLRLKCLGCGYTLPSERPIWNLEQRNKGLWNSGSNGYAKSLV